LQYDRLYNISILFPVSQKTTFFSNSANRMYSSRRLMDSLLTGSFESRVNKAKDPKNMYMTCQVMPGNLSPIISFALDTHDGEYWVIRYNHSFASIHNRAYSWSASSCTPCTGLSKTMFSCFLILPSVKPTVFYLKMIFIHFLRDILGSLAQ